MNKGYQRKTREEKQAQLKALSAQLNQQIDQFIDSPEVLQEYVRFSRQFYHYSLKNRLMIHRQEPSAQFVGSFKFWKEKGYSVKKGEKGIQIFVPKIEQTFSRDGQQYIPLKFATIQERRQIKEGALKTLNRMVGASIGHVFDIAQTNVPIEDYPEYLSRSALSKDQFNYQDLIQAGKRYAELKHIAIEYQDLALNHGGQYRYATKTITLNQHYENENLFSVLIHELAHSQLHEGSDLRRDEREIQAQSVAELVKHYYELTSSDADLSYLQDYATSMTSEERLTLIENTLEVVTELTEEIDDYLTHQTEYEQLRETYQLESLSQYPHEIERVLVNLSPEEQQHYLEKKGIKEGLKKEVKSPQKVSPPQNQQQVMHTMEQSL